MEVKINGKAENIAASTIAGLAVLKNIPAKGVAITVDGSVVPRKRWAETDIRPNANIVIIKAFAGG